MEAGSHEAIVIIQMSGEVWDHSECNEKLDSEYTLDIEVDRIWGKIGIKDKSTGYNPREYSRIEMLLIEMWMTLDGSGFGGQTSRKPTHRNFHSIKSVLNALHRTNWQVYKSEQNIVPAPLRINSQVGQLINRLGTLHLKGNCLWGANTYLL